MPNFTAPPLCESPTAAPLEPKPPFAINVADAVDVLATYQAILHSNVTLTTTSWQEIQSFLRDHPKAAVFVQYRVWTALEPVALPPAGGG